MIEARTTLSGGRISTGLIGTFLVAVLAALLVGGAGGYLFAIASRTNAPAHEMVVLQKTEPQQTFMPNGFTHPDPPPATPLQTLDPDGYVIHF